MNTVIKRSLIVVLMFMMVITFIPFTGDMTAYAEDGTNPEYIYFQEGLFDYDFCEESNALYHYGYDGGVAIAAYHGGGGYYMDAIIPEEVEYFGKTYRVTMIKQYAFYCSDITSVMIPDSVAHISTSAFYNCADLKDIYILGYEKDFQEHCFGYMYNESQDVWTKIDSVAVHSDCGEDSDAGIYASENGFNFANDAMVVKQVDITVSDYTIPDYGDTVVTPTITINSVTPSFMKNGISMNMDNTGWFNNFPYGSRQLDGNTFYSGTAALKVQLRNDDTYYYQFKQDQTQVTFNGEPVDDSMWAGNWMVAGNVYTIPEPGYVAVQALSMASNYYGTISFDGVDYDTYKDGYFAAGKPLTIHARPDDGSDFVEWRKVENFGDSQGEVVGTDPDLTITPVSGEDAYYCAMFTKGVSTSGQATETVNYTFDESTGTLTFTPASGTAELNFSSPSNSSLYGVSKVRHVVIGEGITSINNYLLNKATGVEDVTLPASLEYISDMAFEVPVSEFIVADDSNYFKAVDGSLFSKDGTSMIRYAQKNPGEDYAIPAGVNYIYRFCFNGQSFGTITLRGNNLVVDDYALTCDYDHVIIEDGVYDIRAYHNAPNEDTVINIPASVYSVGTNSGILSGENLEEINVDPANIHLESIDGVLYSKEWDWMEKYPAAKSGAKFTASDKYPDIAPWAFYGLKNLNEVILPENIGTVYQYAFAYNDGLTITVKGMDTQFYSQAVFNSDNIKIRAYEGSEAQSYAEDYGITFEILPVSIDNAEVTLPKTSITYTGKALTQDPTVTVTFGGETKTLTKDTDYEVTYKNNVNVGTAEMTITGINGYSGTVKKTFKITPKTITPSVTLSKSSFTWTGKALKPTVTVKDGSTKLSSTQYKVTYSPSACTSVGKINVKVTLKGNYSGEKTVSYKINPKGRSIKSLTPASKAITVNWVKQATKMSTSYISGYQIYVATDSKFTKNVKKVYAEKYSTVSKKITGLKGGTKYYVKIRTYKTVNGVKYYSPFSAVKTVTTKK